MSLIPMPAADTNMPMSRRHYFRAANMPPLMPSHGATLYADAADAAADDCHDAARVLMPRYDMNYYYVITVNIII